MSARLSSYVIFTELDDSDNKYMLVHGCTGAIDIASESIVSYLQSEDILTPETAPFSQKTWDTLVARGYITAKTAEEEYAFAGRMAEVFHKRSKLFNSFIFIPSYDCNFRCPYCIEGQMSCDGKKWSKRAFTREMVDRAYEAMLEIGPHKELHDKQITLYGGEPLLAENKEIVTYMIEKGCSLGYCFMAITNGYDLDEFVDLLGPEKLKFLQITVDGMKEWHDRRRVHYRDGGSFDKIVANIGLALKAGVRVNVRVNTDRLNFDSITTLKALFTELGYYDYDNRFSMYAGFLYDSENLNPAVDQSAPKKAESSYFGTLTELDAKIRETRPGISCPSDRLFRELYRSIANKKTLAFNSIGCASQSGAYVLDPKGDIYTCMEIVGQSQYVIGNYATPEGIRWNEEERQRWQGRNISTSPTCSRCKYAFMCKGGCAIHCLKGNGHDAQHCRSFREMFKTSVNKAYRAYLKSLEDPVSNNGRITN